MKIDPKIRFWKKVDKRGEDECWNWLAARTGPGRMYGLFCPDAKIYWRSHRYAWFITYGEIPEGLCVLHSCDNSLCVNPEHLFLGTQKDNMDDMDSKGRRATGDKVASKGIDNPRAKLTVNEVIEIRELEGKLPSRKVAVIYDLEKTAVLRIWRRKLWRHV